MRTLTIEEAGYVSGRVAKEEEVDPWLLVSIGVGGTSVGTFSGLTTYYVTDAALGWRLGISFMGFYGGFVMGCLIGAGALIFLYKL